METTPASKNHADIVRDAAQQMIFETRVQLRERFLRLPAASRLHLLCQANLVTDQAAEGEITQTFFESGLLAAEAAGPEVEFRLLRAVETSEHLQTIAEWIRANKPLITAPPETLSEISGEVWQGKLSDAVRWLGFAFSLQAGETPR